MLYNISVGRKEKDKMILKEYRKDKKLSREEFARLVNVSPATINRWENKVYAPSLYEVIRICEVLDLPFTKLYKEYRRDYKWKE